MLERDAGNTSLARELFKCAVKADPKSEAAWLVSIESLFCRLRGWLVGWLAGCSSCMQVWVQMEDLGFYPPIHL